uniref:Aspartyl beta-hydroxylase/Triadin domain-containing protein n=1 Tax=Gasterosteus aculeatus aculeatus TaxID=481459 RepID=A0AAQ4NXW0_GASAC
MASKKNAKVHVKPRDGTKTQSANKNGKKSDSGSGGSFFTWFIVLALLGVWTSVAVVYFDLVDYQGVLGKLQSYDTDGDGDFDVEDAKVLLDETPEDASSRGTERESSQTKEVAWKLREALKQQLAIIHERVEAKKLAKLALAEVRLLLAKEEADKELELGRKEIMARVKESVATRLLEEEEKMEKEEWDKALEKQRMEKAKPLNVKREEESKEKEGKKTEKKVEGEGNKAQEEVEGRVNERKKGRKTDKCDRKGKRCDEV